VDSAEEQALLEEMIDRVKPPDVTAARLERARLELAAESEFDAVVVNESVEQACAELVTLLRLEH